MPRIFISYRREDSQEAAGRLYDRLAARFGADQVFIDVQYIDLGDDFAEAIERAVGSCDVEVAVIGTQWLTITDSAGRRRIDDPKDFVRLEIATALRRKIRVIPVLIRGAAMPKPEDLPRGLQTLPRKQGLELRHASWDRDVDALIATIERVLKLDPEPTDARAAAGRRPAASQSARTRPARRSPSRGKAPKAAPSPGGTADKTPRARAAGRTPSSRTSSPGRTTRTHPPAPASGRTSTPTPPVDVDEIVRRAEHLIPRSTYGHRGPRLCVVVVGVPAQHVLRPSEIEDAALFAALRKEAVEGSVAVFSPEEGTTRRMEGDKLLLVQPSASVLVDEQGTLRTVVPVREVNERTRFEDRVIIEEVLVARLQRSLRFAARALTLIDPRRRISHVVPIVSVLDADYYPLRTQAEHARNPTSYTMGTRTSREPALLRPPVIARADLARRAGAHAQDFLALLRRQMKGDRHGS